MSCPDRYDLLVTDGAGESHGLVCDWDRGGSGLRIESSSSLESTAVSTKGDFGVRDAKDAFRIVQSDWSEGSGQLSYDRDQDSESAYWESKSIDVSTIGTMRLAPTLTITGETKRLAYSIAALKDSGTGTPLVFAAYNASPYLQYSLNGTTWTGVTVGTLASAITGLCTDGQWVYAIATSGATAKAIHYGKVGTAFASLSTDASNAGFSYIAFASGVLYGTKDAGGTDMFGGTTSARVGCFNTTSPNPVWAALSPDVGRNINAVGTSFGLVANGNYVYWGVTNGMVTKIYKVLSGGGTVDDVLLEVCTFPHGFVGACLYSYLGTVYVGGHFDGTNPSTGTGAIYAIVNDTPALLTEVGTEKSADNRVIAMSAYERNLFFISNTHLWRWDLKYGGYSHWAGPLNGTPSTVYSSITWIKTWDLDAALGATLGTTTLDGGASVSYSGGRITATVKGNTPATKAVLASIDDDATAGTSLIADATGTTVEIDVTADCLSAWGGYKGAAIHFGLNGSAKNAWVRLYLDPADGYTYVHVDLYCGSTRTTADTKLATAHGFPVGSSSTTYTVRLTLKDTTAKVYLYEAATGLISELCSGVSSYTPTTVKQTYLKFIGTSTTYGLPSGAHPGSGTPYTGSQYAKVERMRWCDDGAYAPDTPTAVASASIACARDAVYIACNGYGDGKTMPNTYKVTTADESPPYLTYSMTTGNMPTVDKYFSAFHIQLENALPSTCTLVLAGTIDGKAFQGVENTTLSTETQKVFDIGLQGRSIQPTLYFVTTDSGYTPVVTDTAVLFTPMPKTARVYSYYVRCWDRAESRIQRLVWDENADYIAEWLEETANTIVTVERPDGSSYRGKVEQLEYMEAPPSSKARGREGLYQLAIRKVD